MTYKKPEYYTPEIITKYKGKHVPKEKLEVGKTYICDDSFYTRRSSFCWRHNNYLVPFTIDCINESTGYVYGDSLTGADLSCACTELNHLYEWLEPEDFTPPEGFIIQEQTENRIVLVKKLRVTKQQIAEKFGVTVETLEIEI